MYSARPCAASDSSHSMGASTSPGTRSPSLRSRACSACALEMLRAMEDCGIAPKRLRTVQGMPGRAPKFLLIEGVRGGGQGLHWLPPLVLREADGSFSAEWKRIYRVR